MSTMVTPQRPSITSVISNLLNRVRRLEAVPPPDAVFEIKLFADAIWPDSVALVVAGDARFQFAIPSDITYWYLWKVEIYLTTVGSGDTSVQVRNVTTSNDMLNTALVIPAGDYDSCATEADIDLDNSQVTACDQIAIDIDAAGGGDAKGLGITLVFRQGPYPPTT